MEKPDNFQYVPLGKGHPQLLPTGVTFCRTIWQYAPKFNFTYFLVSVLFLGIDSPVIPLNMPG